MGGTGYLVLAVFYLTIDAAQLWNGSPFRYPGLCIAIYVRPIGPLGIAGSVS